MSLVTDVSEPESIPTLGTDMAERPNEVADPAAVVARYKREHSREPNEFSDVIKACSPEARLELFARGARPGWTAWGNQTEGYEIGWDTYAHNSRVRGVDEWAEAAE